MIKNERQYRITQSWAAKFRASLEEFTTKPRPKNVHPKMWEAQKAGVQSQLRDLEDDLREYAAHLAAWPLEEATWKCEQAVRCYDPCISCATHFLKIVIERE